MTFTGPNWKPSRTARKQAQQATKAQRKTYEKNGKAAANRRDKVCRFPLCGCHRLGLQVKVAEMAHLVHKGSGGDPAMVRSNADNLIKLCRHRHQDGRISIHKGTLRIVPLTPSGTDGPVRFLVMDGPMRGDGSGWGDWIEVARETSTGQVGDLKPWQRLALLNLAAMDA